MARRAIRRATHHQAAGGSATTKKLAFCPSDLPVKISIARGGPVTARKLLRLGLQFGSLSPERLVSCRTSRSSRKLRFLGSRQGGQR
jgi:hypothetical protein